MVYVLILSGVADDADEWVVGDAMGYRDDSGAGRREETSEYD